ncbi:aluminum-activated malate transporter 2-like [Euphorbia lathyris]|uniref:aluminum-activated malate transporter 2-like n=1 Tax=Euphorbia lathyris TaxID=212925 RepID=UPI00331378ED
MMKAKMVDICRSIMKVGKDDPRRVIHSVKVGFALTLVSILYYYEPLYQNFGVSAMWAVITVVVVFEYSVGATIGKGLNRGMATLLAAALGIGAHHLAILSGHIAQPFLLALFVFLQAAITTFMRFFPKIKARYDYGMLIFILTFSLISVSGYRVDEIINLAHKRLSTILIGSSACLVISTLISPVWAGQDLHNLVALNMEKVANFLLGFGAEYFKASEDDKSCLEAYKSVLNSKTTEESLANFARWEPAHGRFQFRHPWNQYLQLAALTRQCAYRIEALNGYLNSDIKTSVEIRSVIQETCTKISKESGRALMELSIAVKKMNQPCSAHTVHIENAKRAAKSLKSLLKSNPWGDNYDLLQVISVVTVASILIDMVNCTEKLAESVFELASKANFKKQEPTANVSSDKSLQNVKSPPTVDCHHTVINIPEDRTTILL